MSEKKPIKQWNGLNNVSDPMRLGVGWLATADNIDITSTAAIERRKGYTSSLIAPLASAYNAKDFSRLYAVSGSSLVRINPNMTLKVIAALTGSSRMYWTEVNRQVYFNNGVDRGIIDASDQVSAWEWVVPTPPSIREASGSLPAGTYQACFTFLLPDGRETGAGPASAEVLQDNGALQVTSIPQIAGLTTLLYIAPADSTVFQLVGPVASASFTWTSSPDALGVELATQFMDPLPRGAECIQHWRGKLFAGQHLASMNQSVVWMSEPLGLHLFNLSAGYFMVPGKVLMLASTAQALIVGTDAEIYAYTDEGLTKLADYGVVPGWQWAQEEGESTILIWTTRGVCRAVPFQNITEGYLSVAPGIQAGAAIVQRNGEKKFMANLQSGGAAFNQRF